MGSRSLTRPRIGVVIVLIAAAGALLLMSRVGRSPAPDGATDPRPAASSTPQPQFVLGDVSVAVPDGWAVTDLDAADDPQEAALRVLCGPGPGVPTLFYSREMLADLSNALCPQFGALDAAPWVYVTGARSAFGENLDASVREVNGYRVRQWQTVSPSGQVLATVQWLHLDLAMIGGDTNLFSLEAFVVSAGPTPSG